MKNRLYYGDNLEVMGIHIDDGSVDLVYLDPPFNSNADYNILFQEHTGEPAAAQIKAFEDTWSWENLDARLAYESVVESGGPLSETMQAFRQMLGGSDMLAYLAMMAPRLVALRHKLKDTGSLYLHCDPTASHYLKILLDAIFGPRSFRNEIIWKRTTAHSDSTRAGRIHDTLLFYTKGNKWTWNKVYQPYDQEYVDKYYRYKDANGERYASGDVAAEGPGPAKYFNGVLRDPPPGSHWRFSQEKLDEYIASGRIYFTENGFPRFKRYLKDMKGVRLQDIWADKGVQAVVSWSDEGLDYPTQKPEALLDRIIEASSNVGYVILDPFCGCGTAIASAQRLNRRWIGIDITHLAVGLIKHRLQNRFGPEITKEYEVIGEPVSSPDAERLAREDPFQFQAWALGQVGARKEASVKKGAYRGVDGTLYFHDDEKRKTKKIILSVKAGANVSVAMVRDLVGTVTREKADIGVLISFANPTKPMLTEAADAGFYVSPMGRKYPKIQILTIADLLSHRGIDYPSPHQRSDITFRKAKRVVAEVQELPFSALIGPSDDEEGEVLE